MKKHIPNFLTCCNLFTGCVAMVMALRNHLEFASILIFVAALFDFLDGFSARLLNSQSDIGVDMDSLADVISFGGVPAMILLVWAEQCMENLPPAIQEFWLTPLLPYIVFVIPVFSAIRLAKFNHDNRQINSFRGLPTPANALFLGFLHFSAETIPFLTNFWVVIALAFIFSILLITDIPMFALKMKNFKWKENAFRYIFLAISLLLVIILKLGAFPVIILLYILISFIYNSIVKI